MKVKTLAIPIRVADYSESSQIVSLYTRQRGLVDGIAKGAWRDKSGFQGPFDLAVLYEVVVIERRSEGLAILTESAVVDGFRGLRARLYRQVGATHVLELVRAVAVAGAPDEEVFDLVRGTLEEISAGDAGRVDAAVARLDVRALTLLGLLGPLDACVLCGREWPGAGSAFISAAAGGLLCSRCRASRPSPGTSLTGEAARLLGLLVGEEPSWADIETAWPAHGRSVSAVTSDLRNYCLEKDFRALGGRRRRRPARGAGGANRTSGRDRP